MSESCLFPLQVEPLEGRPGQPQSPGRSPSAVSPSWVMEGSTLSLPIYCQSVLQSLLRDLKNCPPCKACLELKGPPLSLEYLGPAPLPSGPSPPAADCGNCPQSFPEHLGCNLGGGHGQGPIHPSTPCSGGSTPQPLVGDSPSEVRLSGTSDALLALGPGGGSSIAPAGSIPAATPAGCGRSPGDGGPPGLGCLEPPSPPGPSASFPAPLTSPRHINIRSRRSLTSSLPRAASSLLAGRPPGAGFRGAQGVGPEACNGGSPPGPTGPWDSSLPAVASCKGRRVSTPGARWKGAQVTAEPGKATSSLPAIKWLE